jgi:uncharacterized protein (TIGR03067 family)
MKAILPCVLCLALFATLLAADKNPELQPFQGRWDVTELVEDGRVIPHEAIREWLPSGGKLEIVDNALMYASPQDGKKHAKIFTIDPTQIPKGIELVTREKKEAVGIYKFDDGQLVVCLSDPEDGPQPTEFSAKAGSKRMLMVLKRAHVAEKAATAAPSIAAKVLTDAELAQKVPGTWRYLDDAGALVVTIEPDGTWSTIREVTEMRLFKKVFVQTPVSSGTWTVSKGTLNFLCTSSIHLNRVNHTLPFAIRSISDKDMIFVDYMGRLGKAVRIL